MLVFGFWMWVGSLTTHSHAHTTTNTLRMLRDIFWHYEIGWISFSRMLVCARALLGRRTQTCNLRLWTTLIYSIRIEDTKWKTEYSNISWYLENDIPRLDIPYTLVYFHSKICVDWRYQIKGYTCIRVRVAFDTRYVIRYLCLESLNIIFSSTIKSIRMETVRTLF